MNVSAVSGSQSIAFGMARRVKPKKMKPYFFESTTTGSPIVVRAKSRPEADRRAVAVEAVCNAIQSLMNL